MWTGVTTLQVSVPPGVREFLQRLASTEGRLVVTGAILLVVLVSVVLVAPFVVRRLGRTLQRRVQSGRFSKVLDRTGAYLPRSVGGLFLRTVQVAILLFAGISLLVVWGLIDLAVEVLTLVGLSVPLMVQLATTLALALAAYIAADVLEESVDQFATRSDRITDHQQEIILRVGNIGILALVVAGGLTVWGVDLSGLLVGAGFLGIVVGLAARQTLGSLIAGFVLMFSRPFTIGDWVAIGDDEGIVAEITIVNTRLENFDGETIVIPNDRVSNQPITNRSQRGHLRIRLDVGVDYETDPDHAVEVAHQAIASVDSVTETPPPRVVPKSFGDSAVILELRFWIDRPMPPRKWQAVDAVVRAVKDAFESEGIKIPFPQRELSGRAETGGFRIADEAVDGPGSLAGPSVESGSDE
jgi:small-conductance mechanosensitive channel